MKHFHFVFLLLMIGSAPAFDLSVGQAFPSLTLPSIKDGTQRLSTDDFRGEKWILHLFASW